MANFAASPLSSPPGRVLGVPGGGLASASWAHSDGAAKAGRHGEECTAAALAPLALRPGGVCVLHDLRIPVKGTNANIDHAVVAGRQVLLIDTKTWKPGFIWTVSGVTRRGRRRFAPADKSTLGWAMSAVAGFLRNKGAIAELGTPILTVWPPAARPGLSAGPGPSLWAYRPKGVRVVPGPRLAATVDTLLQNPSRGADPSVVAALSELLVTPPERTSSRIPRPSTVSALPPETAHGRRSEPIEHRPVIRLDEW